MQTGAASSRPNAFQKVRKATAARGIVDQFKTLIRNNHYVCGSKLPSEQELADELGVSRPTVREAEQTLSLFGVLDTRHGSGTRVAESVDGLLKLPIEFLVLLDRTSVAELYETRETIEVFLAGQAALRRTEEDLETIETALHEMTGALHTSLAASVEPDLRFHHAVATASHNRVFTHILVGLRHGILNCMNASVAATETNPQSIAACMQAHRDVAAAIGRRNARAARAAMTEHMQITRQQLEDAGLLTE